MNGSYLEKLAKKACFHILGAESEPKSRNEKYLYYKMLRNKKNPTP